MFQKFMTFSVPSGCIGFVIRYCGKKYSHNLFGTVNWLN